MKVNKVLVCSFHCKPRPSGVSVDSSRLENIAQVQGNRAEVGQNYDARKAVSATFSVRNIAPLHFKTEKVADNAFRAS